MIIIQQNQDEEENQYFVGVGSSYGNERNNYHVEKLKKIININREMVMKLAIAVLLVITITMVYKYSKLAKQLEVDREVNDRILSLQASILNYQSSDHLIPLSKSIQTDKLEANQIYNFQKILAHYLIPYTDSNCKLKRYGNRYDGGYLLCQNLIKGTQILLNFGIEDDDSFGCQIINKHQIMNYQFDCTKKQQKPCKNNQNHTIFNEVCLGGSDISIEQKQYSKLQTIIDRYKLVGPHLIVKIDIQGSEWQSLFHASSRLIDRIDQLVVQFHQDKPQKGISWNYLRLIRALSTKFIPVNLHMNNFGCYGIFESLHYLRSNAFQVTFVKRNLIKLKTYERSYQQSRENMPNEPSKVDCQM